MGVGSSAGGVGAVGGVGSFEINRVRSSPSLAPSGGRFPFHYTPHVPAATPPTLRELDARYESFWPRPALIID